MGNEWATFFFSNYLYLRMNFLKLIYALILVSILGCSKDSKSHSSLTKSSIKKD